MMITVFTPAYNRAHLLPRLYESLCKQTFKDFEWLIVDDGSTDDTQDVVNSQFIIHNSQFPIRYFWQENGGKPSAINNGAVKAAGELFFIVDSDDYLTPTALETIAKDWDMVCDCGLCGISYLKGYSESSQVGNVFDKDHGVDNYINVNQKCRGDKAEVWVTAILQQYKFPIFPGEKFIGESYVWNQIAFKYDMLFVNKIIYICDYLEGGLSKSGKKMRINNPLGGMAFSLIEMSPKFKLSRREKRALLYVTYGFFAKKKIKDILNVPYKSLVSFNLPIGWLLYQYWKWKYQ